MNKFLKLGVMALACTFVFSGCRIKYETGSGETDGTVGESAVESSDKAGGEILHVKYANESYTPYLEICKTEFEKKNQESASYLTVFLQKITLLILITTVQRKMFRTYIL